MQRVLFNLITAIVYLFGIIVALLDLLVWRPN